MQSILRFSVLALAAIWPLCCVAQTDRYGTAGIFGAGAEKGGMGGDYVCLLNTAHSFDPRKAGGMTLELGYAHGIGGADNDGLFAASYLHTFNFSKSVGERKINAFHPFLDVGYTRFFVGGNALHYGGGLLWHYSAKDARGIRLEYRRYSIAGEEPVYTIRLSHELSFQ